MSVRRLELEAACEALASRALAVWSGCLSAAGLDVARPGALPWAALVARTPGLPEVLAVAALEGHASADTPHAVASLFASVVRAHLDLRSGPGTDGAAASPAGATAVLAMVDAAAPAVSCALSLGWGRYAAAVNALREV